MKKKKTMKYINLNLKKEYIQSSNNLNDISSLPFIYVRRTELDRLKVKNKKN